MRPESIRAAARALGIQGVYTDGLGRRRRAPDEVLEALVDLIGAAGAPRRARQSRSTRDRDRAARRRLDPPGPQSALALFLPLYAIRSERALGGVGDFTDLGELASWAIDTAGALTGTLPLFPAFLDMPFDPSPYAPVTRLFWGEHWVDVSAAPEFAGPGARRVRGSAQFRAATAKTRAGPLVDYRALWRAKRSLLRVMSEAAWSSPGRRRALEQFERAEAGVSDYARFRAATDAAARHHTADARLYVYAQMVAAEQMGRIAARARPLYLDLPIGVHACGFEVQRCPDLFLRGVSAGAPPDALHAGGQMWGFPPMHPFAGGRDGYAYLRRVLRRMFSVARVVRIDHVMGLKRLYCIPPGFRADQGAYLGYPAAELFGVLVEEASRAGAAIVGEDLGTVPASVRHAMRRCGVLGMHVQQFALGGTPLIQMPRCDQLACLNTHDTPTFAGFWHADDVRQRVRLGALDRADAAIERSERAKLVRALRKQLGRLRLPASDASRAAASLMALQARSEAPLQLVNVEDLWGERRPQNVPGTRDEYPNWRRRARYPLARIMLDPRVRSLLEELAALRARARRERTP